MDDIVKRAMLKWPTVPHCYGWLALDARGNWRMRDEHAQHANLPGDKIVHTALLAFINRNYGCDEAGRWYFQNGPQRVFVNLEATPFIARTDPLHAFLLHTGAVMTPIDAVWLTDSGRVIFESAGRVALLDDRDTAQCLGMIYVDVGADADVDADGNVDAISDDLLLEWIASAGTSASLVMMVGDQAISVGWRDEQRLAKESGFVQIPLPDQGTGS